MNCHHHDIITIDVLTVFQWINYSWAVICPYYNCLFLDQIKWEMCFEDLMNNIFFSRCFFEVISRLLSISNKLINSLIFYWSEMIATFEIFLVCLLFVIAMYLFKSFMNWYICNFIVQMCSQAWTMNAILVE